MLPLFALLGCNTIHPNDEKTTKKETVSEALQTYEGMPIDALVKETDSTYRVQIGMLASSFWLHTNNRDFKENYKLLNESLQKRILLDITVQYGTSAIIKVHKSKRE